MGLLSSYQNVKESYVIRNFLDGMENIFSNRTTLVYFLFLSFILLAGLIGPYITPYEYDEYQYENGELLQTEEPSLAHPLGTTARGHDVLSRILHGARPTVITGLLGGFLIIGIGLTIGVTAGYMGGSVDDVLMRFTDMIYGIPLLPTAIVLISVFGFGFFTSITVIGLLLWRGNARVLRSQVLQIRERPYVLAARATGAGHLRTVVKHILPNIMPMAILFFALGVGYSIILQAGLAFLGVSSPFVPSWGIMVRNAYNSGLMAEAWWWSIPPGLLISLTVLSTFMFGRSYESNLDQPGDAVVEGA